MRKEGFVEQLVSNKAAGLESKAAATRALNAVLSAIETGIKKDGEVQLVGFGTFKIKSRPARKGRNPGTGAVIKIKASKTVAFKCGSALKAIAGKARPGK
jgi:nucleoid DNA-binding protein